MKVHQQSNLFKFTVYELSVSFELLCALSSF
jgi:hypothetical protein